MKLLKTLIVIALLLGVAYIVWRNVREGGTSLSDNGTAAWYAAKQGVVKHLKAPATAKFPTPLTSSEEVGWRKLADGSWETWGYVDSQNAAGALLRDKWRVIIRSEGKRTWRPVYLRIGDEEIGTSPEKAIADAAAAREAQRVAEAEQRAAEAQRRAAEAERAREAERAEDQLKQRDVKQLIARMPTFRSEAEAQQFAMQKYPKLAVPGSDLNKRFLNLTARYRVTRPELFTEPAWPLVVADEAAQAR